MHHVIKSLGVVILFTALAAHPASAHIGLSDQGGFARGFMHPLGGLDHVLAMVAVGFLAARMGGRAVWLMPLAFVAMMAFGSVLGFSIFVLPFVEQGIGLSVIGLGLLVALRIRLPTILAMALAGTFAVFHGHAHGTELTEGSAPLVFALGFVMATSLLHIAGIGLGLTVARLEERPRLGSRRVAGAVMAVSGMSLVVQ